MAGKPVDTTSAALAALEPFFDPGSAWSGASLEHFAFRALRELYPDLSVSQAYALLVAAKTVYGRRPFRAAAHRPS